MCRQFVVLGAVFAGANACGQLEDYMITVGFSYFRQNHAANLQSLCSLLERESWIASRQTPGSFLILALIWLWKHNGWTADFGYPLKTSPAMVVLREDFESIQTLSIFSRAWFLNSKQAFLMHPQCNRSSFRSILAPFLEIRVPLFIYRRQKEHVIGCS